MNISHETPELCRRPFASDDEICHRFGDAQNLEPALIVNPSARLDTLLAAATSRLDRLEQGLATVECAGESLDPGDIHKIAHPAIALAQECRILLEAAQAHCPRNDAKVQWKAAGPAGRQGVQPVTTSRGSRSTTPA